MFSSNDSRSILNESLSFALLPAAHRTAFLKHGEIEKQYFPAHTEFYRFTQLPVFGSVRSASPWWAGVRAGVARGEGLAALSTRAARLNVSPQEYLRARSAVTWEWNTLAHLVIVRLARPAYGLVGRCRHQQYSTDPQLANVAWIGGAWQVYLPNLTPADVTLFAPA